MSMHGLGSWSRALVAVLLAGILAGCGGDRVEPEQPVAEEPTAPPKIVEVAPPTVLRELEEPLARYRPQVSVLSPQNGETIEATSVAVQFDVKDYPLFKNEEFGAGPHLHVILDNEPYRAVYSAAEPITFEDLSPGTHTVRAFASRPWHESFKNEGAFARVTFNVFTDTQSNNPTPGEPLLTYSRPKGTYGAEPIMLDFYLTDAPIALGGADWRVRATINGESFVMDSWMPVWLEGFEPGQNWIELEYIDAEGNPVVNAFNNTARLITLQPGGEDTLSRLVRGELSAEMARGIVDPNYVPPVEAAEPEEEEPEASEVGGPETEVEEPEASETTEAVKTEAGESEAGAAPADENASEPTAGEEAEESSAAETGAPPESEAPAVTGVEGAGAEPVAAEATETPESAATEATGEDAPASEATAEDAIGASETTEASETPDGEAETTTAPAKTTDAAGELEGHESDSAEESPEEPPSAEPA